MTNAMLVYIHRRELTGLCSKYAGNAFLSGKPLKDEP